MLSRPERKQGTGRQQDKAREIWFSVSLVALSMAAFLLIGADGYVLFDDSGSYLNMERYVEGVMPLYPLFLRLNRIVFGEAVYLQAVVVEQAVFACVCVILFTHLVRRRFQLGYLESYGIYLLSLLPFTTDMPDAMTTQEILTEGIAYAAFYLFMAVLLTAVWKKSLAGVAVLYLVTQFLAATRSQLQILFGVCGVIFFYIVLTGKGKKDCTFDGGNRSKAGKAVKIGGRILFGLAGCLFIGLVGVWCTSRISTAYQQALARYTMRLETERLASQAEQSGAAGTEAEVRGENADTLHVVAEEDTAVASQYTSLIFSRGMYEADYEDYHLFKDEQMKELFLFFYETADREGCLYTYAHPGLWMWKDIVGGIGSVGSKCFYAQEEYYAARPELLQGQNQRVVKNANWMTIGLTLIRAHWGRLLYHTLMMLPQAFICTVFFQIAEIYLLCHLVTLFLYLSAVGLMIWAYLDKKVDRAYAEFMSAVLGTNLVMIVVISLVFFGQQRYLVYNFGIFYMIYFLLLLQLWKIYGKNWLMKWIHRRKS